MINYLSELPVKFLSTKKLIDKLVVSGINPVVRQQI